MCVHKPWNLKYDIIKMTAVTNEDFIGWLLPSCCLMKKKWSYWQPKTFPIPRVSHKGSGEGETVQTWWVQEFCDIFGKKGNASRMILGDNPAGHGFVLREWVLIGAFSNKS